MFPFFNRRFYFFAVFIAWLTSIADGLSLEELSLKIQQLERTNEELTLKIRHLEQYDAVKDIRLQELEMKFQHFETERMEQGQGGHLPHGVQSAVLGKQINERNVIFRTCTELHQADPSLKPGMYWIDPDGQGVGDDPIYVECDMTTGKTSILHDSEDSIDVGHCADPGCYSRPIEYSASMRQMDALSELSNECHQSIRYDCNYAPFESNGVTESWWNDKNGVAQYFWSGSNNSVHTCQCGIDHNCVELHNNCNCDSLVPIPLNDSGVITDKKYLPITRLNFGRTQLETSSGVHTLGRFECTGQVSVSGMPKSCSDLWKIGHSLSGFYSVMGSKYVETVYCDFAKLPQDQGFQRLIGYSDVKSSPVYFYVQKDRSQNVTGQIPYEVTRLNIGGAMNPNTGIFTAPRSGIYSFAFSGLGYYPTYSGLSALKLVLLLNGYEVGRAVTHTQDDGSYYAISLHSTLELKTGDQVWMIVYHLTTGAELHDNSQRFTHFTGHLLQENVASSMYLS